MSRSPWRLILLPALLTFAAGFLVGQVVNKHTSSGSLEELPADLRAYEAAMTEVLGLRGKQRGDLRVLLFHYEREREKLLQQHLAEVDSDWVALDDRFENLLANRILDADQRRVSEALQHPSVVVADPSSR
jgi:DNA polymerase III delta prime subunit